MKTFQLQAIPLALGSSWGTAAVWKVVHVAGLGSAEVAGVCRIRGQRSPAEGPGLIWIASLRKSRDWHYKRVQAAAREGTTFSTHFNPPLSHSFISFSRSLSPCLRLISLPSCTNSFPTQKCQKCKAVYLTPSARANKSFCHILSHLPLSSLARTQRSPM